MIENKGPTIYKGESIYKTGAGGAVLPQMPENIVFLEYYQQAARPDYFYVESIFVDKTDVVYFKFRCNIYTQPQFKLCEAFGNNSAEMELNVDKWPNQSGGNIAFRSYNISSNRITSQDIAVQNDDVLYNVKRTAAGWYFNGVLIQHNSNRSSVEMVRYYLTENAYNSVPIKVYKSVVTTQNGLIKYQLIPAKNTQNDYVGFYCPELQRMFYPNTQRGYTAGPEVYY